MPDAQPPAVDDPERPALAPMYRQLRDQYVNQLIDRILLGEEVEITFNSFVQWIRALAIPRMADGTAFPEAFIAQIKDPARIRNYVAMNRAAVYRFSLAMLIEEFVVI